MTHQRTTRRRALGAIAMMGLLAAVVLAPAVSTASRASAAAKPYYAIQGAGSTWSKNAIDQWVRNVGANYGLTISYNDSGSSAGRQLFSQGTMDFGVSEIPYALAGSDSPDVRPTRQFAYIPIVAGGTAFMYNLSIGGKQVKNLRLSGDTVTKIFTGVITKWNDQAIAADNPKLGLPATPIVPVVRSDGSGTSAQFTAWMRSQHTTLWNAYCAKAGRSNCGITSNYPVVSGSAFVGQALSTGVSGFVKGAAGSITYVEESYALNAGFPVAKLLNSAGYYTEPNASNVAVSLLSAVINKDTSSPDYLTANLTGVYTNPDPRTYPLSSYSYMIIPTALESGFTTNKGLTLAEFASYFLCEGQQQADSLGYSPLPVNLASAGLEQIQKIPGGDPTNTSISSCNNPTFSPDGTNKIANNAPQPQPCDKKGPDQCLTGTGGATSGTTADSSKTGSGTAGAGAETVNESVDAGASNDGSAVGLTGGGEAVVAGSPVDLPERGLPPATFFLMLLAVVAAAVAALLPPILTRQRAFAVGTNGARERAPRGRPARTFSPRATFTHIGTSAKKATVHLRALFRKGGSALPPKEES